MPALRAALARIAGLFSRSRRDRDLEAELESHLQLHIDDNIRAGMSVDVARRDALLKLGGIAQTRERYHDRQSFPWIEQVAQDLRYAVRTIGRSPGFAVVAILSLAIGIGANTLVFSVVNALLLAPLPVDRPERVVFIEGATSDRIGQSFPNYRDLRDRNTTFEGLFVYRISPMSAEWADGHGRAWGYLASGNYFDPSVVGRTIRVNRSPLTIVGVAPAGFYGMERLFHPDLWAPMAMQPQLDPGSAWLESRNAFNVWMAGRLKSGISAAAAEANLNAIGADLIRQYPNENEGLRFVLTRPGLFGDFLRTPVQAFTFGVLALAALVLFIACANLAGTLAARTADRAREIALRLALGAGRGRIVRQLITETLALALMGGAGGGAVAVIAARAMSRWHVSADYPVQLDIHLDVRVFFFALLTSTLAGLAFGVGPARHASQVDPQAALKGSGPLAGRRRWAVRDVLVSVQVAVCVVLLAACLLSLQGLRQALTMPIGYQPHGVAMVGFDLSRGGYTMARGRAFQQQALAAIRQLPGVEHAAYADSLPLTLDSSTNSVFAEDEPPRGSGRDVPHYSVSPGFFETLGMPLKRGRDVDWKDTNQTPRVAIVNEAFVRQILHASDPIGRRFRYGRTGRLIEVVGVVGDSKIRTLAESPQPAVFDPTTQLPNLNTFLLVRSSMPSAAMVSAMRKTIADLDPALSLYNTSSVDEAIGLALFPNQAAAVALTAFGVMAMVLAMTGIHGVVSYAVARRRREIGIRVAIGAAPRDILSLVLGRMTRLLIAGAAVGVVLAVLMSPLLMQIVYLASPREPSILAGVGGLMLLIGLAACWGPARASLRVEPVVALRAE